MKKVYFLKTCDSCIRILKRLRLPQHFALQNTKETPISAKELEFIAEKVGSYGVLFNKRAKMYRARELQSKSLTEPEYKSLILEHYTFLKRPIIVDGDIIFVGNSPKIVSQAMKHFNNE